MATFEDPAAVQPSPQNDHTPSRKRFQNTFHDHLPTLLLDASGTLLHCTSAACRLLAYASQQQMPTAFTELTHARYRTQVARDIRDVAQRRKRQAYWLVRLRTGRDRWRWYRASAKRWTDQEAVAIRLRDVYE